MPKILKNKFFAAVFLSACSIVAANDANIGDFSTNQQADTIDNSSTSNTKVTQKGIPVNTAVAPASPTYSQDVCVFSTGTGVQTQIFGIALGQSFTDETCQRLKLSKQLKSLDLTVGAVSVLCQDNRVFWALYDSGTPCPTERGLIGDEAYKHYKANPDIVPMRPAIKREKRRVKRDHSRNKFKRRR